MTHLRPAELLTRLIGRASFFGVGLVHVASLFFLSIGGHPKASESLGRVRNAG